MAAIELKDLKKTKSIVVGASETDLVLGEFSVQKESAINFRLDCVCSSVTVGGGITVKVQHKTKNGDYTDLTSANSSVSVTGNGTFSIVLNIQNTTDQSDLPLRKQCRAVVTTGAGSAITLDEIIVQS